MQSEINKRLESFKQAKVALGFTPDYEPKAEYIEGKHFSREDIENAIEGFSWMYTAEDIALLEAALKNI